MVINGRSGIAVFRGTPARAATLKPRTGPVFGVAVHQTGSGVVDKASRLSRDPLEVTVDVYLDPDAFCGGYVIAWDGRRVQIVDDLLKAQHIGLNAIERQTFVDDSWATKLPAPLVELWHRRWPKFKSPIHLFPGASANMAYIGVELIPTTGTSIMPLAAGLIYTREQHDSLIKLCADIASRHNIHKGWELSSRLVGHEDINPVARHTPSGCWDPGNIRELPWIDWGYITRGIAAGS